MCYLVLCDCWKYLRTIPQKVIHHIFSGIFMCLLLDHDERVTSAAAIYESWAEKEH